MSSQDFVGNKPVDSLPPETVQKIDDEMLAKQEAQRNPAAQPGASKRAGAASRNSRDFDTSGSGGYGDTKPVNDPVL